MVLLAGARPHDAAMQVADRIHEAMSRPVRVGDVLVATSVSIGLAHAEAGDDVEGLLNHADDALYQAKRTGRARSEVSSGASRRPASARRTLEIVAGRSSALDHPVIACSWISERMRSVFRYHSRRRCVPLRRRSFHGVSHERLVADACGHPRTVHAGDPGGALAAAMVQR